MDTICIIMPEKNTIKKIGNSVGVFLDRGALEKVYGLVPGSEVEIEYDYPKIIIKAVKPKKKDI